MGSGSSQPKPETTQSAPPTAKNTPRAPQRNKQFQEVQLGTGQAGTSQSRQKGSRSPGANPNSHQSTSQSRTPRDKEVGASGHTSTRQTGQRSKDSTTSCDHETHTLTRPPDISSSGHEIHTMARPPQGREMPSQQAQRKHMSLEELLYLSSANELNRKDPVTVNSVKNEINKDKNLSADKKNEISTKKQEIIASKKYDNAVNKSDVNAKKAVTFTQKQEVGQKSVTVTTISDNVKKKPETVAQKQQRTNNKVGNVVQKTTALNKKSEEETIKTNATGKKVETATNNKVGTDASEKKGSGSESLVTSDQISPANDEQTDTKEDENHEGQQETTILQKLDGETLITDHHDDDPNDALVNAIGNVAESPVYDRFNGHLEDDSLGESEIEGDQYYQGRDSKENEEDHGKVHEDQDVDHDFFNSGDEENHHGDQHDDGDDDDAEVVSVVNGLSDDDHRKEDDLVFETFYHRSGKEFQCIYQSGMRFYLDDWGSKEWQPFPKRWYNEGLLVTNTILKDDGNVATNEAGASGSNQGQGQSRSQGSRQPSQGTSNSSDDREGFIMHPSRGRIPTYIFYKKHNVHMYFDKDTGTWVRLPIGWELHHPMVKALVDQVEEAVPHWGDRHDILSLLRACNYDPDECISIYMHLQGDEWMKVARTSKEAKSQENREHKVADLEKKVRDLEISLQKERAAKEEALKENEELTLKVSELEVENKQTEAQLSAATGGRPKTARPVSRMMVAGKVGKGGKGGKQVQAGEVVNPGDILDLNETAKEIRKSHTRLKLDVEKYMGELKSVMVKMSPAFKQLKQSEKGTIEEIEEVRALYRKEALQRRLLYNQLQELRGNIRVFCRARKDDRGENCLKFPTDQDIICTHPQQGKKMFSFDRVFAPNSTQEEIFEETKNIITSCADGYNICLLAYGQTGSGKTFTMMGPEKNPGINVRAMKELFQVCGDRTETMKYEMNVALVEIYNEHIQDLLTSDAKTLELRTAGNKVDIPGLTYLPIEGLSDVKRVMEMGDKNRTTASTKMNSTSSRSHLVLMLAVTGQDKVTNAITKGTLTLCDLAGSERIAKTEAEGQRLVEAAAINKSLSALGQVFTALRTSQLHTPFRNSKLTQILQPSLSGDAKACLFVNVSPDVSNFLETVSTLSFGSNARQVALGQAKQNVSKVK